MDYRCGLYAWMKIDCLTLHRLTLGEEMDLWFYDKSLLQHLMEFHFLFSVLLVPGSFSILNVVVTNILKTLNFNQTLSSNGSLDNFSDPTFMKDYMEALTFTASITFFTGIIQVEDEPVLFPSWCILVRILCTNVRIGTACLFLPQILSSSHLNTYVVQNGPWRSVSSSCAVWKTYDSLRFMCPWLIYSCVN